MFKFSGILCSYPHVLGKPNRHRIVSPLSCYNLMCFTHGSLSLPEWRGFNISDETTVTNAHAVQSNTGTDTPPSVLICVTSQVRVDTNQEVPANEEQLSSDILAFCALLARIVMRCLKEQDE